MGEPTAYHAPVGIVAVSKMEWVDELSGRLLNQHERAVAFVRDYLRVTGEWPAIKRIVNRAGVGTGTAWRALKSVRAEVDEGDGDGT